MTDDKELEQQLKAYAEIGKENPAIDTAALITKSLDNFTATQTSPSKKALAYFVSLGFPPFGLLFAVHFYLSDKSDARHIARMCIFLTILSIGLFFVFMQILVSSIGPDIEQLQTIDPNQLRELLQ